MVITNEFALTMAEFPHDIEQLTLIVLEYFNAFVKKLYN